MSAIDKALSSDINLGFLFDALAKTPNLPLIFLYDGYSEAGIPRH